MIIHIFYNISDLIKTITQSYNVQDNPIKYSQADETLSVQATRALYDLVLITR